MSAGYFKNHFSDAIVQGKVGVEGKIQYTNINGDEHTSGFEFEATYELNPSLMFRGAYTRRTGQPEQSFVRRILLILL